jgi:hydroxyacylglutathione hydrolase
MTQTRPPAKASKHTDITVWGIGPRLVLLTVLYSLPAILVQGAWPSRFLIPGIPYAAFLVLGSALVIPGLPIWILASRAVDRAYDQGILATQGMYSLCRHPIYGAAVCLVLPGIFLFFRSWLLLTIPAAAYLFCRLLLRKEEAHLRRTFGRAYEEYEKAVPMLFPKFWNLEKAFFYPAPTGVLDGNVSAVRDGDVNLFLYTDGRDRIAVDCGCGAKRVFRELEKLAVDPETVTHLFLTHTDMDHAGGLALFPKAKIHLPAAEERMIDGRTARLLGVYRNRPIARPYALLQDGDLVTAGTIRIRAIASPGHTPGSMSYLVNDRALFTGDALRLQNGTADVFYAVLAMDVEAQRKSIRKLASLQGIGVLCTAHTGCTTRVEKAMERWRTGGELEETG